MNQWITRRSSQESRDARDAESSRGFNSTSIDSQYQRDRARIIHCASFRALQFKTQVLGLGESDFYRTRLTHSLEVAQIGSGISEWIQNKPDADSLPEVSEWIPSFSLIEAICLAHDIGHSPFGHGGEVALNYLMHDDGGFEANGQTLRIIARLGEYSTQHGLDLTRRTQLGTIKYPAFYADVANYPQHATNQTDISQVGRTRTNGRPHNIDQWAPPKCIYDSDRGVLEWMLEPFSSADRERFLTTTPSTDGHARSRYKSLDTSIMELADDIAYGVHDLEDALALGLLNLQSWQRSVDEVLLQWPENPITRELGFYHRELFSNDNRGRKHAISKLVGYFIRNVYVEHDPDFSHPLLCYRAVMAEQAYALLQCLKHYVMQEVILRPELQALQYKGQQVIINLFDIFANNPRRLLPPEVYAAYSGNSAKLQGCSDRMDAVVPGEGVRAIADYLSAMTDVSAGKLYHKLSAPTSGPIFDRL